MKELSIEERAKRYDKLFVKASRIYNKENDVLILHTIEDLFPELKESEDERIKEALIEYFRWNVQQILSDFDNKEVLAWLEKQEGCEYKKKDWLEHIKQSWYKEGFIDGKYTPKELTINDATTLNELIDYLENGTAKLQHDLTLYANWLKTQFSPNEKQGEKKQKPAKQPHSYELEEEIEEWLGCEAFPEGTNITPLPKAMKIVRETANHFYDFGRKQQEYRLQKSADKVEPKFHEGDWITNGACIIQITSVDDRYYWHDNDCVGGDIESMDKEYHLWSIDDAKDGDALRVNYLTFLFREVTDNNCQHKNAAVAYCSYVDGDDSFGLSGPDCITNLESIHPATKEQRDLLFAKMKEAGYEWDADKKELKKADVELTDFEKSLKHIMIETLECGDTHNLKADAEMLLRFAQKPAWSEEDEKIFNKIIQKLDESDNVSHCDYADFEMWLIDLKERLISPYKD